MSLMNGKMRVTSKVSPKYLTKIPQAICWFLDLKIGDRIEYCQHGEGVIIKKWEGGIKVTSKLSSKALTTLPKPVVRFLNLKIGDKIEYRQHEGVVIMSKLKWMKKR